jgi:hypothetical protein
MNKKLIILIIILIISGVLIGGWFWLKFKKTEESPPQSEDKIKVTKPLPNEIVSSPIEIEGEARGSWFFEASFPIQLLDENGEIVGQGIAQAQSDWMTTDFVPFKAEIGFPPNLSGKGILVFKKDNPSGLPENYEEIRVQVIFQSVEATTIKIFLNNDKLDPEFSCNKVFPVEREVVKTQAVARASLEELLKGPTEKEKAEGFFTNINLGVKIQKLTIENGVAKVDFDEQLEFQVGGSCKVAAIRSQITQTLKQFSTVNEVIISINGRTEDILQP